MKTLSDHPLLIGRLLEADKRQRERKAAADRFWRSPLTTVLLSLILLGLVLLLLKEINPAR